MKISRSQVLDLTIFENLQSCHVDTIVHCAQEKQFSPHETLFSEAEKADGMHILLEGSVKLVRMTSEGRELVLFIARDGQSVGEGAVFQNGTHALTALAMEKTTSLFLPQKLCFELVQASSIFALRMLSAFSLRQRMLIQKLSAQGERNAARRVAGYILHRYFMEGTDTQVPFYLSREDMANLLGLARETLSRQLSQLMECGAISIEGRIIHIKNEQILRNRAKGE